VTERTIYSLSEQETEALGRRFATALRAGTLVVLIGDLGLGKTVFARGVAVGLGVPPAEVSSPTFTLVQEYPGGRVPLFHVDLYRVEDPRETEELGLDEILESGGIVLVEWGERLPERLRRDAVVVRFVDVGEDSRRIELADRGAGLLASGGSADA
jgi:tRNA threonylcarbamoyladenosine biosynthesis protein TsaE